MPVDAVLLSHDHHSDNLDRAGGELLADVPLTLTTVEGANRLGGTAKGLTPGDNAELSGGAVHVTAVAAEHGPPEVAKRNGPVVGFVVRGDGLPTIYVSGDNASLDVVEGIVETHGPFDVAVLFAGGAQLPEAYGDVYLTLDAVAAAEAATRLSGTTIVPVHQEGWAHLTSSPDDLRAAFVQAGLEDRLRLLSPGEQVSLAARPPFHQRGKAS
jgi:L-ascorbate metabolism protein UlaG (beta-lactamase superfamily)